MLTPRLSTAMTSSGLVHATSSSPSTCTPFFTSSHSRSFLPLVPGLPPGPVGAGSNRSCLTSTTSSSTATLAQLRPALLASLSLSHLALACSSSL